MVALVHKNTNLMLILIVCGYIFGMLAKQIIGYSSRFLEGPHIFDPLEKPLEIANDLFCPHKNITSRTI
jgi:hypothetical protein